MDRRESRVHKADQSDVPKFVDGNFGRVIELRTSPATDVVALTNHRQEVIVVDLQSKKMRILDHSPTERIHGLAWSPDGRWLAYGFAVRPGTHVIKVADIKTGRVSDITDEATGDFSPAFDPEGKYLYFLSAREYYPVYDTMQFDLGFPASVRPYVVPLRKDVPSPFIQKPRAFIAAKAAEAQKGETKESAAKVSASQETKSKSKASTKSDTKAAEAKQNDKKIEIDFDGIQQRILGFPVPEGALRTTGRC